MAPETWKAVTDRYLSAEAKADFARTPMPDGFDQAAYAAKWSDLAARIEAALPMPPDTPEAHAFHAEWQALLAPFTAVATPAMQEGVVRTYDAIDTWQGERQPPFSSAVWAFIKAVGRSKAAGCGPEEARGAE